MTIDEAIKHADEVANKCEFDTDWGMGNHFIDRSGVADEIKCGEEHRQLAEWLKDYKRLKEQPEITWVTGTDGAKVAFWDVPIPKVLKICEILQEPTITSTEDNAEMTYPQVEGITPTVVNEDIYECSCGYGWDKNKISRFHFCPNCGKAVGDGNDYKYIKSISNPTGIEFDIDIDKKVESYGKLLKHPVIKHIMDMDETQEQLDFVQPHKRIPVTLTVSDDLISREAVEEIINDIRSCISVEGYWAILERLKKLPSVKPQERTGHWVLKIEDWNKWICSECGHVERTDIHVSLGYDFCPKCGANMSENPTGSKDVIWYSKRNYSEIVVEPQESEE